MATFAPPEPFIPTDPRLRKPPKTKEELEKYQEELASYLASQDKPLEEARWSGALGLLPTSTEEFLGAVLDPSTWAISAYPGAKLGETAKRATFPIPQISEALKGRLSKVLGGLRAKSIEKMIPPERATPIRAIEEAISTSRTPVAREFATEWEVPMGPPKGPAPGPYTAKLSKDEPRGPREVKPSPHIPKPHEIPEPPPEEVKYTEYVPARDRFATEWQPPPQVKTAEQKPPPPKVKVPLLKTPEKDVIKEQDKWIEEVRKRTEASSKVAPPKRPVELTPQDIKVISKYAPKESAPLPPSGEKAAPKRQSTLSAIFEQAAPPHYVLDREPSGAGRELLNAATDMVKARDAERARFYNDFRSFVRVKRGTIDSKFVGYLLDNFKTPEDVPKSLLAEMRAMGANVNDVMKTFEWMRKEFNRAADTLESRGILLPDKRIATYFHHTIPPEDLIGYWKAELNGIEKAIALGKKDEALLRRADQLRDAIDTALSKGIFRRDVIPKNVDVPILKERKGALKEFNWDSIEVMLRYHDLFERKIYHEPFQKKAVDLIRKMPIESDRRYAEWASRNLIGIEGAIRTPGLNHLMNIEKTLAGLEYLKDIGFLNTRTAVVNLTQHANTIAEFGPTRWFKAATKVILRNDPIVNDILKNSGIDQEINKLYASFIQEKFATALNRSNHLFKLVELGNRKVAYVAGYLEGLEKSGGNVEEAIRRAEEAVRVTQFIYGPLGTPRMIQGFLGAKVATQYMSYPLNQFWLFHRWLTDPKISAAEKIRKLGTYVVLVHGTQEGLKHLGIDMSAALGFLDAGEFIDGMVDLFGGRKPPEGVTRGVQKEMGKSKMEVALPRTFLAPSGMAGSGPLPVSFAPIVDTMGGLVEVLRDLISKGSVDPSVLRKVAPVMPFRVYEAIRAFQSGEIESTGPIGGVEVPPERGYPIYGKGKEIRYLLTAPEVVSRTLLSRPYKETSQATESALIRRLEEKRKEALEEAARLRLEGRDEEAAKIIENWGAPSKAAIEAIREKLTTTPHQRAQRRKAKIITRLPEETE